MMSAGHVNKAYGPTPLKTRTLQNRVVFFSEMPHFENRHDLRFISVYHVTLDGGDGCFEKDDILKNGPLDIPVFKYFGVYAH